MGGLQEENVMGLRMFKHSKLVDLYALAKLQEATNNAHKKKSRPLLPMPQSRFTNNYSNPASSSSYNKSPFIPVTLKVIALPPTQTSSTKPYVPSISRRQLTQKEMEERRAKNLCFYCDQKYSFGHKFNRAQMFTLEVIMDEQELSEEEKEIPAAGEEASASEVLECLPQISLNAINGINA